MRHIFHSSGTLLLSLAALTWATTLISAPRGGRPEARRPEVRRPEVNRAIARTGSIHYGDVRAATLFAHPSAQAGRSAAPTAIPTGPIISGIFVPAIAPSTSAVRSTTSTTPCRSAVNSLQRTG